MSNPISALNGKAIVGPVAVRDQGLTGMISLRGDLGNRALQKVCKAVTGVAMPGQTGINQAGEKALCWMSPDEVLILVPHGQVADALAQIEKALDGQHFMAVNVSDARALIAVEGPFAREVIAKLAPVDLHPDSFGPGQMCRSRLGQVAAAFWMMDETTVSVICFRSVADYAFDLLAASAAAGTVNYFVESAAES